MQQLMGGTITAPGRAGTTPLGAVPLCYSGDKGLGGTGIEEDRVRKIRELGRAPTTTPRTNL